MNVMDREQVRLGLLRLLAAKIRYGLTAIVILSFLRNEGFRELTKAEVEEELEYLRGKGLAERIAKMISPENEAWRITAAGRDEWARMCEA